MRNEKPAFEESFPLSIGTFFQLLTERHAHEWINYPGRKPRFTPISRSRVRLFRSKRFFSTLATHRGAIVNYQRRFADPFLRLVARLDRRAMELGMVSFSR